MSNYVYTNDGLINADELMHYGVPGMKWGHRKTTVAQDRVNRKKSEKKQAMSYHDKRLKKIESKYAKKQAAAKAAYTAKRNSLRDRNALESAYRQSKKEVSSNKFDYAIARRKAKVDKSYKQSKEYQNIKQKYVRDKVDRVLYGKAGRLKIKTLKQSGYTEFGARLMTVLGGQRVRLTEFKRGAKYEDLTKDE